MCEDGNSGPWLQYWTIGPLQNLWAEERGIIVPVLSTLDILSCIKQNKVNSQCAVNVESFPTEPQPSLSDEEKIFTTVFTKGKNFVQIRQYNFFEHTCAYARWAHMHRFLSVVTGQKI